MTQVKRRSEGRVVKLSQFVASFLKGKGEKGESFDSILRRQFGLESRKGEPQPLPVFYVVPGSPPYISDDVAEARGKALLLAARKGLKRTQVPVITVRQVL